MGLSPLETGDPIAVVTSKDQLTESVQKAAGPPVVHQLILEPDQGSPMTVLVDPGSHS